jgi:hypothetical protein
VGARWTICGVVARRHQVRLVYQSFRRRLWANGESYAGPAMGILVPGHCRLREPRSFRVDRILRVKPLRNI